MTLVTGVTVRPFPWYAIPIVALAAAGAVALAAPIGRSPADLAGVVAPAGPAELPSILGVTPELALAVSAPATGPAAAPPAYGRGDHAFYFTRGIYTDRRGGWGRGSWAVDYPKADQQFLTVLRRLTNLDAYASENAVRLDDPELRRYPFLYILEVGGISLTPAEVTGLRDYLLAGGFVFVDDFWGDQAWYEFERQMRQVLPEHAIVDIPMDHEIFRVFYEIREVQQMPSINHWRSGRSTECWGCEVTVRGIEDEKGRLMMLIHWNTDNGDAWEWAEQPDIPLKFTTYAYQIGVNAVVYALSH
jgi:hypothetical protein